MNECIIFDLDGTLVDSAMVCVEVLNEMLAERGSTRVLHSSLAKPYLSLGGAPMVSALLGSECGDPEVEIADFRRRYADRPTPMSSLYDGVHAGLVALSGAGARLAICSNKPQNLCDKVLDELGLASLFEVAIGGRSGYRPKPATDLLDLTLQSLNLHPASCVYVGDSDVDHEVAQTVGIPFHFMTYGYSDPDWTIAPLNRHDHFTSVVSAILGSTGPVLRQTVALR